MELWKSSQAFWKKLEQIWWNFFQKFKLDQAFSKGLILEKARTKVIGALSPRALAIVSHQNWISSPLMGKLCFLLNHLSLIVDWDCDTANAYDGSASKHSWQGGWPNGCSRWELHDLFRLSIISHHSEDSWKKDYFQSAAIGQEFAIKPLDQVISWAKTLIENCRADISAWAKLATA